MLWLALLLVGASNVTAEEPPATHDFQKIQGIVEDFRARLSMAAEVVVSVVPRNSRLVSVQRLKERKGIFLLSFEDAFLGQLSDAELEAVIAHELGHIWIFSHHPYLHTERLANQIAMRLVSRESLEKVYERVWERGGSKGDLARFLGEPPTPAVVKEPAPVPSLRH
jgi:hypothetical protein